MGRGNFLPHHRDYAMWYLDTDAIFSGDEYESDFEYENFKEDLLREIRKVVPSMEECKPRWLDREEKVIAENKLATLSISDNEWSIAIVISADPDSETFYLAVRWIKSISSKVEKQLLKTWPTSLHRRTSAWTSEQIKA